MIKLFTHRQLLMQWLEPWSTSFTRTDMFGNNSLNLFCSILFQPHLKQLLNIPRRVLLIFRSIGLMVEELLFAILLLEVMELLLFLWLDLICYTSLKFWSMQQVTGWWDLISLWKPVLPLSLILNWLSESPLPRCTSLEWNWMMLSPLDYFVQQSLPKSPLSL